MGTYQFDADTEVTATGDGHWRAAIAPDWNAISGVPNGGYLLATALAATTDALGGGDPLTVTAHYLRPGLVGPADIEVEVVRRGRLTSTAAARLSQDGKERLRVLAAYGNLSATGGPATLPVVAPAIPGPDECAVFTAGTAAPQVRIAERFDFRFPPASRWISGKKSGTAEIDGWIRFADGRDPDVAALPLIVDAFPPSVFEVVDGVLTPTVELTVHIRQRPEPGWLQARLVSRALLDGMLAEDVELWDSTGRLVAMSRQLALVVPAA